MPPTLLELMTSMSANAGLLPERVGNAAQERIAAGTATRNQIAFLRLTLKPLVVRLPSAEWPESAQLRPNTRDQCGGA